MAIPTPLLQPTAPDQFVFGGKWVQQPLEFCSVVNAPFVSTTIGNGTIQFAPLEHRYNGSYTAANLFISNSLSATNAGSSRADTLGFSFGLYERVGSSLSLITSNSASTAFTVTGSSSSVSYQGIKLFPIAITLPMAEGNYYYGIGSSSSSAGNAVAGSFQLCVGTVGSSVGGVFGASSAVSNYLHLGLGQMTVTSASLPTTVAFTDMVGTGVAAIRPHLLLAGFSV